MKINVLSIVCFSYIFYSSKSNVLTIKRQQTKSQSNFHWKIPQYSVLFISQSCMSVLVILIINIVRNILCSIIHLFLMMHMSNTCIMTSFFTLKYNIYNHKKKSISLLGALVNKTHTYLNYMCLITTDKRTTVKPE